MGLPNDSLKYYARGCQGGSINYVNPLFRNGHPTIDNVLIRHHLEALCLSCLVALSI